VEGWKKIFPVGVRETINYNTPAIPEKLTKSPYMIKHLGELTKTDHVCTIKRNAQYSPQFFEDFYIGPLLEEAGVDTKAIRQEYGKTVTTDEACYKDFVKYLEPVEYSYTNQELDDYFEGLAIWQETVPYVPRLMSIDDILPFIERSSSSTAFLTKLWKNKGACLDDHRFRYSFVKWLKLYVTGKAPPLVWTVSPKEEIRLMEKVIAGKIRSFVIGPLFHYLLSHMLFFDLDKHIQIHWEEYGIGAGMSLFYGDYSRKFEAYVDAVMYDSSDVSRWDGHLHYELMEIETRIVNLKYHQRYILLSKLLGSWDKYRDYDDIEIDVWRVRLMLTWDSVFSYNLMPNGEVVTKRRGMNSGSPRTLPLNTKCHKGLDLLAIHKTISETYKLETISDSLEFNKREKLIVSDETGDDKVTALFHESVLSYSQNYVQIMKKFGFDVDVKTTKQFSEMEYLSTRPLRIKVYGVFKTVPRPIVRKLFASLLDKTSQQTPAMALQRSNAVRILCAWDPSFKYADYVSLALIRRYQMTDKTADFQNAIRSYFPEEFIRAMYIGSPDSGFPESFELLSLWVAIVQIEVDLNYVPHKISQYSVYSDETSLDTNKAT